MGNYKSSAVIAVASAVVSVLQSAIITVEDAVVNNISCTIAIAKKKRSNCQIVTILKNTNCDKTQ